MRGPPPALIEALIARGGQREGLEIRFRCVYPERHKNGDTDPSARFHERKAVWCCDACGAGGGWQELYDLLDVPNRRSHSKPVAVATYDYRDESGALLRRKLRWEPGFKGRDKSFTWEKPDGRGGWTKCKGDGNPKVLYGSEQLPAARLSAQRVLVVEGEKDADRASALGLVAVCNPEGAGKGKWKAAYSDQLQGLSVVVIADRDPPGRAHAKEVAQGHFGLAASVRLLELPGDSVKDLSDWVAQQERQGSAPKAILAELERLFEAAPPFGSVVAGTEDDQVANVLGALEQLGTDPDLARVEGLLRDLGSAMAGLDRLGREVVREQALKALAGKIQAPGRWVDAALREPGRESADALQGRALSLDDPEPWPEAVDGAVLLDELEATFLRFLVLPEGATPALALWTLHTHAMEAAFVSPLLAVTSPEKRCGKSTLLSLLKALTRRPLPVSNITAAALFRAVEKLEPTLLIDEADTFFGERDDIRGILNCGHTRESAYVVRTVGDTYEPRCFTTWGPKAVAQIGRLHPTLEDRAISIPMKRKTAGETVERLRLDRLTDMVQNLKRRALRWALDRVPVLRAADPDVPPGLHDRAADNWRPLLAIADDAGGSWPMKARAAAMALAREDGDSSARAQLLADVRSAFTGRQADKLFTEDLLTELTSDESRPWGEWRQGKPLTPIGLSRLLKPLGVAPRKVRIGEEAKQGYRAEDCADAFTRYLPPAPDLPAEPEHPEQLNDDRAFRRSPTRNMRERVPGQDSAETPTTKGLVPGVPAQSGTATGEGGLDREVFDL